MGTVKNHQPSPFEMQIVIFVVISSDYKIF